MDCGDADVESFYKNKKRFTIPIFISSTETHSIAWSEARRNVANDFHSYRHCFCALK